MRAVTLRLWRSEDILLCFRLGGGLFICGDFRIFARIPTLAKSRLRRLLAARACGRSPAFLPPKAAVRYGCRARCFAPHPTERRGRRSLLRHYLIKTDGLGAVRSHYPISGNPKLLAPTPPTRLSPGHLKVNCPKGKRGHPGVPLKGRLVLFRKAEPEPRGRLSVGIRKKHRNVSKEKSELVGLTNSLCRGKETISFY